MSPETNQHRISTAYFICVVFSLFTISSCELFEDDSLAVVGSYKLLSWQGERADGSIAYPYGEDARGMIIYSPEGTMSMSLSKMDRDSLGTDDYKTLDSLSLLNAYGSFFSYSGTYAVSADTIHHRVALCKQPDWRGRKLDRLFTLVNDTLTLQSAKVIGMDHTLVWVRLGDG